MFLGERALSGTRIGTNLLYTAIIELLKAPAYQNLQRKTFFEYL